MTAARSIRRRLLVPMRNESGMALPVALFATVAALALAGAAVMSSVDVQLSSHRDSGSKNAIAAADAGANVALLRLQRDAAELASAPCIDGAEPEANGWCPPVSGEVGGAEYSYEISQAGAGCGEFDLCIVSTGLAGGVSRRVEITLNNKTGGEFGGGGGAGGGPEGLIGAEDIEIDNVADARVNVGSNGNVYVHNNGNVCGNIRHGIGKEVTFDNNGTQCGGYAISEENLSLPPVSSFMPADIATENSNYRLIKCVSADNPEGCQLDGYSGKWKENIPWDPATRTISTFNNATLTLTGGDYFVCKLLLSNNSHLIMADGTQVRIFFDTPENCGLTSGAKQIDVSNNANITSTGYQPSEDKFDLPGLYVMGSTTIPTTIEWSNNSGTNEFVLYAPNSHIELKNNAVFVGMIAGKTVHLSENAIVKQDDGYELPPILDPWATEGSIPVLAAQYYVECGGDATPTPTAGC